MGTQVVAAWSPLPCSCSTGSCLTGGGAVLFFSCTGYSETNPREVSKSADGKTKPPRWCGLVLAWPWTNAQDHVPGWRAAQCSLDLTSASSPAPGQRQPTPSSLWFPLLCSEGGAVVFTQSEFCLPRPWPCMSRGSAHTRPGVICRLPLLGLVSLQAGLGHLHILPQDLISHPQEALSQLWAHTWLPNVLRD